MSQDSTSPGLIFVPLAKPGWRCPEGLQCCSRDALKQHGNVGRTCLAPLVALLLLGLPAMLHSQQQQPEPRSCKPYGLQVKGDLMPFMLYAALYLTHPEKSINSSQHEVAETLVLKQPEFDKGTPRCNDNATA